MTALDSKAFNLLTELNTIDRHWTPKHVLTLNSTESLKLAKIQGDFIWHCHPETDEMFYIVSGGPLLMDVATSTSKHERDGFETVTLSLGDVYNVPQGVRHRPRADAETGILVIEKIGTVNTGDEEKTSDRTVHVDEGLREK
jgi:mannose-6-phosphate isomerase-like protein (cupin superfamily)